jgi:hypothetical protein
MGNGKTRKRSGTHKDTNTQTPAANEASRKTGNTPGSQRGRRGSETTPKKVEMNAFAAISQNV